MSQAQQLSRLAQIHFDRIEPIRLMWRDGAALEGGSCHSLVKRLTSLWVTGYDIVSSEIFDNLAHFTSLTRLHLCVINSTCIEPRSLFYDRFDSPSSFLPRLTSIMIDDHDKTLRFKIVYDYAKESNYCEFSELDNQAIPIKKQIRVGHNPVSLTPPPAPLVGIESNPGPTLAFSPPSSATSTVTTPATLFTDGLAKIFSHLSLIDFIMSGRVSHHWFVIAASERTRKMRSQGGGVGGGGVVVVLPLSHKIEIKTQSLGCTSTISGGGGEGGGGGPGGGDGGEESNTESNGFTSTLLLLPPSSKWRLSHQVSDLSLTRISDWHQIPDQLQFYPHLTKLNLSLEWQRHVSTDSRPTEQLKIHSLLLPHWTLTALSIHRGVNHLRQGVQFIFDGIGECTQLTSLSLGPLPLAAQRDEDLPCDLTPLSRLLKLQHLCIISLPSDRLLMKSLFSAIGQLPSLTTLRHTMSGTRISLDLDDIVPLELPQLTHIGLFNSRPDYQTLMTLHARMPNMVEVELLRGVGINLLALSHFRQLESLKLINPPQTGENNRDASSTEFSAVLRNFSSLKFIYSALLVDWNIVFNGDADVLPLLSKIVFSSRQRDPLTPLFDILPRSQPLISRLTRLTLYGCSVSASHLLDQLGAFTSLTFLYVSIPTHIPKLIVYERFDSSQYLPPLSELIYLGESEDPFEIRIEFNVEKSINSVRFIGQTEDQLILHRTERCHIPRCNENNSSNHNIIDHATCRASR